MNEMTKPDNYLDGPVHNGRFDIDKRLNRALKDLAAATENPEMGDNETLKIKSVTGRMLLTEATLDLLDKYAAGNGKYPFETEGSWEWPK